MLFILTHWISTSLLYIFHFTTIVSHGSSLHISFTHSLFNNNFTYFIYHNIHPFFCFLSFFLSFCSCQGLASKVQGPKGFFAFEPKSNTTTRRTLRRSKMVDIPCLSSTSDEARAPFFFAAESARTKGTY
ncbi:unnamed protein product [Amoebophrya sp. A120]|nr:unnamed protein product [Amoebophrya sp. A120]|eukprot:GSA120T00013842001.1